jgi:putative transposase
MTLRKRLTSASLVYHVFNCGNNGEAVFAEPEDRIAFVENLARMKERCSFALYGYCILPDHFHLLLRPGPSSISRVMRGLLISHANYHRRVHGGSGHVWQGRFKSPPVQEGAPLLAVLRYAEACPLRSGLSATAGQYPWSSYPVHGEGKPDQLLAPLAVFETLGDTAEERRRRWAEYVHQCPDEQELAAIRQSIRTEIPYGSKPWILQLAEKYQADFTVRPRGRPRNNV